MCIDAIIMAASRSPWALRAFAWEVVQRLPVHAAVRHTYSVGILSCMKLRSDYRSLARTTGPPRAEWRPEWADGGQTKKKHVPCPERNEHECPYGPITCRKRIYPGMAPHFHVSKATHAVRSKNERRNKCDKDTYGR
jgi:hypothetical protein